VALLWFVPDRRIANRAGSQIAAKSADPHGTNVFEIALPVAPP